ncbi:hypothetical protein BS78_08G115900 [Paspalum vaginatum]|nr:hypothetical protein BS78_08G115900 [Paspalum vaginatum]KAJ1265983.1 hypothetical protein BS78_08G115900 [Paspalum vaginatum]
MAQSRLDFFDDSFWPEVRFINGYAVFIGYLTMGVKGLGVLIITWTTVVLLGGFVSVLGKKDLWSLTAITLVQTAGVFNFVLTEKISDFLHSLWGLLGAVATAVVKVLSNDSSLEVAIIVSALQVLVLAILLCPLAVLYVFGLYISAGISLWRLLEHDFGIGGDDGGGANLKPALEVLYILGVAQGVLFCYKTVLAYGATRGLIGFAVDSGFPNEELALGYLEDTMAGCEKDPSSATGRNIITYAMDLMMEAKSNGGFIAGVRALGTVLDPRGHGWGYSVLAKHLLARSASSAHLMHRLLETLGPRSPYSREIREHASRIVALVASGIRLEEQFPHGGIQCISSLLDTFEECSWRPEGYKRHSHLPKDYERGWLLEQDEVHWLLRRDESSFCLMLGCLCLEADDRGE